MTPTNTSHWLYFAEIFNLEWLETKNTGKKKVLYGMWIVSNFYPIFKKMLLPSID